ncbi:MAG: branched-chain amino acid ABC transporter permease [Burkholderiales bacterium]
MSARYIILLALTGVALTALPWLVDGLLGITWVRILSFAALYVLLALGLNITVGYAGLLDLGYIAFFAVGAYTYALLSSPQFGLHWPLWATLPLAAAAAGLFGLLLGTPLLRLRGDYLAIVTLGFGEITRIFINNLNAPVNITNGPQGVNQIDALRIGGIDFSQALHWGEVTIPAAYMPCLLFLALAGAVAWASTRLEVSRVGRAWQALREDPLAAAACGIDLRRYKLLAFALGASAGGLAGALFAGFQGFISPESFSLTESIMILCMIVLGGMGHVPGVIAGALILAILPEALRALGPLQQALLGHVWVDPADLRMLVFGLALVAMTLLRPAGLWPRGHAGRGG